MPTIAETKFAVGDEVNLRLGATTWRGRIVEDRGGIGINGRQLFRVQFLDEPGEPPRFVEVPRENLELVSGKRR